MEIREVDPYNVSVDEMNERKENLNLSELEQSVEEQGVIQPPLLRRRNGDAEVEYSVVVGQRRTLAAQGAGLESMPAVVMEWDDGEALEASITENIDSFREDVSKTDRALAIERLKQLRGWVNQDVADHLGVSEMTVRQWLEPTKDEWQGTAVDPEVEESKTEVDLENISLDKLPQDTVRRVREVTGGGEEGEELLKRVAEHDLSEHDVKELSKKIRRGRSVDKAIAQTIEEKHSTDGIKVSANVTFSGSNASAITELAKDRGMTENEVVREAISNYLEREGYL